MGEERCERQNLKWDYFGINKSLLHRFCPCFAQWDCSLVLSPCWAALDHLLPELPAPGAVGGEEGAGDGAGGAAAASRRLLPLTTYLI